ncbi:hypothetical protein [Pseudorhizobium pelagicum]|uniref:Uncharacterized protein n=1 Tax=Pseudorhizobium pelagicum TaxID=1509405 RepID=A0A922P004_9HYPH|nr:hypothetical protein [Pseudorhizobium pelagicum]KEQ07622.1 hypothetical protein GV68_04705 [Pseudorhizobium pelagicum]
MLDKSEPSRAIANCLRCLRLGLEIRDLDYMGAWLHQAQELVAIQGSDEQHAQVLAYENEVRHLRETEEDGGRRSALLAEHPLVVGREKILCRRASRLTASAA